MYLGDKKEWNRSLVSRVFPVIINAQTSLQARNAPLEEYVSLLASAPPPMGGSGRDNLTERHLLSHASGLQRQDRRCWGEEGEEKPKERLGLIKTSQPFQCPIKIIRGEERLGGVLFDDHERQLRRTNPEAQIVLYAGCGHLIHQSKAFERRFLDDLEQFISQVS
jgi:pimeloyl-ACP methyl ester carboxylesterase